MIFWRRTGEANTRMSWKNFSSEPSPKLRPNERTSGMNTERESRGVRALLAAAGWILTESPPAP